MGTVELARRARRAPPEPRARQIPTARSALVEAAVVATTRATAAQAATAASQAAAAAGLAPAAVRTRALLLALADAGRCGSSGGVPRWMPREQCRFVPSRWCAGAPRPRERSKRQRRPWSRSSWRRCLRFRTRIRLARAGARRVTASGLTNRFRGPFRRRRNRTRRGLARGLVRRNHSEAMRCRLLPRRLSSVAVNSRSPTPRNTRRFAPTPSMGSRRSPSRRSPNRTQPFADGSLAQIASAERSRRPPS